MRAGPERKSNRSIARYHFTTSRRASPRGGFLFCTALL